MSQELSATTLRHPPAAPGAGSAQGDLQAFLTTMLEAQCRLVAGLGGIVVLVPTRARRGGIAARHSVPAAHRADPLTDPALVRRMERLAAQAAENAGLPGAAANNGLAEQISLGGNDVYAIESTHRLLAVPLRAEGRVEGAVVILAPLAPRADADELLLRLSLATARFETFLWRQQCLTEAQQKAKLRETLELLDTSLQGQSAEAMGSLMAHELMRRFGCLRVSIGLIRRGRVRIAAVSGADELDRRGAAVEALEAAMEECADQDVEIMYPPPLAAENDPGERRVTRAHEALSTKFGPSSMLSLPLRVDGDLVGVVLLERSAEDPFPPGSASLLRLVAEFIGPALWTRRLADRGVLAVARDRLVDASAAIVGPRYTGAKMLGLAAAVVLAGLAFIPIPGRVSSDAEMEAAAFRTIAPPFTGYLATVAVKPGDRVEAGQLLASLDDREFRLRLAELEANRETVRTQRDQAQAEGEAGQRRALEATLDELDAKINLIREQIDLAQVRAPIAGIVSRGDLEALVGARVEPTQPLFEIVTESQVLIIQVDERDIDRVRPGQEGTVALKALPGRKLPVRVLRVNPTAEPVRGANVYLAEAELLEPTPWARPGMTGTARLRDGWTTGLGMIMRPLIDEFRMRFWW